VLAMAKLHGELLDAGLLGVLKAWIEPMPDGTLPNSKIRSSVLNMLTRLPVDCSYEDRKEQLKRSGMGRIVMFLSKLPDELPANRRTAQQLVEKWSRPILAPRRDRAREEEEEQRILKARQRREQAKRAAAPAVEEDPDNPAAGPRPGQPGFRYRAAVPEGASLDYVNRPASKVASLSDGRGGGKAGEHKLNKKLRLLGKKTTSRAANVSVEGRNVTVMK
jgi:transcription factor SPN1